LKYHFAMRAAAAATALLLALSGCGQAAAESESQAEEVPFAYGVDSYADIDLSAVAEQIYAGCKLDSLLAGSVEQVTDSQTLSELYYMPMDALVDYAVYSADGRFGAADVAIMRVRDGRAEEVAEALEQRKADRIAEFLNFNVNDSYNIALNADIYEEGELVIMLMLSDSDKATARGIIDSYLPAEN